MNTKVVLPAAGLGCFFIFCLGLTPTLQAQSNLNLRVMAANLNGNTQSYQPFALRIFQGLKPDVVAIQEFNYTSTNGVDVNTPLAMREMVDIAFGTNFYYFREPTSGNGDIPNGIISRYPFITASNWTDTQVANRSFAWARIDVPGTNDLYVVSVHFLTSSATARSTEANNLKTLMQANFPANAWIVLAGDFNASSRTEACVTTYSGYLSDFPVPVDNVGNSDTSANRNSPHDFVLPSLTFTNFETATVFPTLTYPNGLVFDSRVYTTPSDLTANFSPVLQADSGNAQHMAVMKDFLIPVSGSATTNPPAITTQPASQTNSVGANVTFSVNATGTAPLAYQWRFFGVNIGGATLGSFSLTNIQTTNAGDYAVVITNSVGSITSSIATLTVIAGPTITNQPQSLTVNVGDNAAFTVGVAGASPLAYQWRFGSTNLAGATNSFYTRTNSQLADAGNYAVVITNSAGSVTSSVAVLTVNLVSSGPSNVVISQIYGGGGNTSATYRNDFVELFNPTASPVALSTWSVQYASTSGTSWQAINLNGTIQPYHYYLVQAASGGAVGSLLPTADATGGINMSASQGKVALANSQTALSGSNPVGTATVMDFVGFGSANAFEGAAAAAGAPSGNNTTSILRKNGGFTDSNNNTNDFTTITPPAPRNSASPANPPSAPAAAPALTNAAMSSSQFQFLLTGTTGSNYVVQATTNLGPANWISLRTNAAPFTFVESNVFDLPQRFYRGLVAP